MIKFIRSLFESALKTNDSLEFAVITGCLRIAGDAPSSLGSKRPHQVINYVYTAITNQNPLPKPYWSNTSSNSIVKELIEEVTNQLLECISYNDYKEDYYHGFLCGLLKGCKGYRVNSNRESGTGRYDIVMRYPSARGQAMIMEIKVAATFDELEAGCDKALKQIEEQKYDTDLRKDGYRNITKYGICFYKKECMVKKNKSKK